METEKAKVRQKTRYAVRMGRLVKPAACACGNPRVEAHHADYSKPLEVTWECSKCHKNNHHKKTHCPAGHEYSPENTRTFVGADGFTRRKCRECDRAHARGYWKRHGRKPKPEPTTCIDCGQPTTPGKGSARCPGCWEDRCGQTPEPAELPVCYICHGTDKYCGLCNGQSRKE